ncbi:MAG: glucose-6-phosphate dehydrogenase [Candidatus Pacebacteria bacterium]|nr:glucose-6-phosphate dehydrogenase [Candidatus Paceibacterota bacterium]NUQ57111.1 glucose-6-phosphate dehydrogenase [Candidatus Paceibacter sp.]
MKKNPNGNLNERPVVFFIFGATGDLAAKKIIPALFNLYGKKALPKNFKIVGFARKDYNGGKFAEYSAEIVKKRFGENVPEKELKSFRKLFEYHQGQLPDMAAYASLAEKVKKMDGKSGDTCDKIFYLSIAPEFYGTVLENIAASGLDSSKTRGGGRARIIIEKPFGDNLKSAQKIEALIGRLFNEDQIYRIDHYLGKEMLQNILAFRFANNLLESSWSNKTIESINISLLEELGVEHRGAFYDAVGAFRDVGQNHLLQALALITMERPKKYDADSIIKNRAELLEQLIPPSGKAVTSSAFRAQYKGYGKIEGVKPSSRTETYFKVKAALSSPRWKGVPIILEGGKRMGERLKEIVVSFKPASPLSGLGSSRGLPRKAGEAAGGIACQSELVFRWEPEERIKIKFCSKKPGAKAEVEGREFDFFYRDSSERVQYVEEYEKLISDCLAGDRTHFISAREIYAMWKFADAVVRGWEKNLAPLHSYEPGSKNFS